MILTFDLKVKLLRFSKGRRGRNLILVWFTTTDASSAFKSCSWWSVLDTTLCDKVCQWLATGWWFSPGTLDSSINKTDHHDITEILLKVVLNTKIRSLYFTSHHQASIYTISIIAPRYTIFLRELVLFCFHSP